MTSPFRPEDELADPNTPAERLAEIATARIDLSAAIARHPNAHDALLDWIATYGDDAARAAVAQRRGMQPAQPTVAPTQQAQPHGDPPFPQQGAPANPHQPVQDFGQQPDHAFGAQPAPMQPGVAWAPSPVVDAPRKKSKKGLVISLSAVGVVVLVAGSGAVWAASAGLFGGGSNSPEAAASKLVDGALDVDPIALYTSMAPSEMTYLEEAVKTIGDIGDSGDDEYLTVAQDVLDAIDVTSSDLTYETDQLMDEVARVRLIGGTVTIDADVDELEEALRTVAEERYDSDEYGGYYSDDEIEEMVDRQVGEMTDSIGGELPYTIDFAEEWAGVAENSYVDSSDPEALARAYPYSVMAVDEGGWFVSPLLTVSDTAFGTSGDTVPYGTEIIEAKPYDSPEAALAGFTEGVSAFASSGDYAALAETMPLAERRWMSLFGDSAGLGELSGGVDVTFGGLEATSDVDGDRAAIDVQNLEISAEGETAVYSHPCISIPRSYGEPEEYCITDVKPLTLLGLEEARPIAVKEDGGWLVGPIATVSNAAAIAANGYQKLVEEGREDELFDSGF